MKKMYFKQGDVVEVMKSESPWNGSYLKAKVLEDPTSYGMCRVKYKSGRCPRTNLPMRETVNVRMLRPYPACVEFEWFEIGDVVDAFDIMDAWWKGVITQREGVYYKVYFETRLVLAEFRHYKLRLHQEWEMKDDDEGEWKYTKNVDPEYSFDEDSD
ncbi:hypothetical protein LXL04_018708 [Taraxacum kok-saghyz]